MSKLGQLRTCLNLMTARQNSCLSPLIDLSISITYLLLSLLAMLKFPSTVCEKFGFYFGLSSYYECTYLQYCSDMLLWTASFGIIRRFLTSTATATLVSAFVLSRIDYCKSLLFGSTHDVTSHLQRIHNYAARVILRLPMSSSISIHLKSLHWLPVKVRSTYKIACLCYHCHSSTALSYVTDMLHKMPLHTRNTRSSSYTMPLLNRPAHSKATLGDRSFSFAGGGGGVDPIPCVISAQDLRPPLGARPAFFFLFFCFFLCLELYSKWCQVCPITVII